MSFPRSYCCLTAAALFVLSADINPATAQTSSPRPSGAAPTSTKPTDYRSPHFLLHTDLPAKEAKDLLDRLETMLGLISKYWGRPSAGVIECYVAKDLANWPGDSLDPRGRAKIAEGAGVTHTETLMLGTQTVAAKSVVYACAERGTAQHEAVHAYCGQTFGTTGPVWYSEGMAEMGQYWKQNDSAVNCHPIVVKYLRTTEIKSLNEIVNAQEVTGDSWQNYAWRWALCHLLATNPNYAARFRPMGLSFLAKQPITFEQTYGAMADEISFEYRFFIEHLEEGFRVDLCSWDWKRKFVPLTGSASTTATVLAGRGWQPSAVTLTAGQAYDYSTTGKVKLSKDGPDVSAAGDSSGQGKLVGVIFKDFKLGEPFDLGEYGMFTAPSDGKLFLRCRDNWSELADNKGSVSVKFKLAGAGK